MLTLAQAPSEQELRSFAFSQKWLSLYNYEKIFGNWKSAATESVFFFASDGRSNPLSELNSAMAAFKQPDKRYGHLKLPAQCAFPARFERVRSWKPGLFPKILICPELEEWKKNINMSGLSVLYAGPYPNNPASMFGHTLLRLKRRVGNWLLDYTVSFLASVDPTDGPVTYTLNGILGGYTGLYKIDPYYINAAQYNNAESRDIWEFDLNLSAKEIDFFLKHLWETSLNTGFPYYFLNENCSYYLLALLNTVHPRFNVLSSAIFLQPIETIKVLKPGNNVVFRASLRKSLLQKIASMNQNQVDEYREIVNGKRAMTESDSALVLDAVIDKMKALNYTKKTNLSQKERKIFEAVHQKRAKLDKITNYPAITSQINPALIHDPSKVEIFKGIGPKSNYGLNLFWGYHGLGDSEVGLPLWSMIDFLGLSLIYEDENIRIDSVTFAEIYSLNPFYMVMPELSWRMSLKLERDCFRCNQRLNSYAQAGVGLSHHFKNFVLWEFLNLEGNNYKTTTFLLPTLELGSKFSFKKHIFSFAPKMTHFLGQIQYQLPSQYHYYFLNNSSAYLRHEYQSVKAQNTLEFGIKSHF